MSWVWVDLTGCMSLMPYHFSMFSRCFGLGLTFGANIFYIQIHLLVTGNQPSCSGLDKMTRHHCGHLKCPPSTVWYKTRFGSQIFGYQIWCLFCYIYNVFENMFNMSLMIMWWNIMVQRFPMTEMWALKDLEGYQLTVVAFWKINFQGRDKLIFQSMSPNEFSEVSHTIGCKTVSGTVC